MEKIVKAATMLKKTPIYQQGIHFYKNKMVLQLSCLYNGNIHTRKDSLYIESRPRSFYEDAQWDILVGAIYPGKCLVKWPYFEDYCWQSLAQL